MARLKQGQVPGYILHKASGKAFVRLNGRTHYLPGPYGSSESQAEYDRLIGLWTLNGRQLAPEPVAAPATPAARFFTSPIALPIAPAAPAYATYTVGEFVLNYLAYAKTRYAKHGMFHSVKSALRPLVKFYESLPLVDFGPKKLIQVRRYFIQKNLVRREVNKRVYWIKNAVRWAVAQELIPGEVIHRLDAVDELRRGKEGVRESAKVRPVDEALINATLPFMPPEIAVMVETQFLTGARSGEVCIMRSSDIDMSKDVCVYKPQHHKTEDLGYVDFPRTGGHSERVN